MSEVSRYEKSCGSVVYCRQADEIKYLLACENSGYWVFPKGHMENGETEQETALREIREETGINVAFVEGFRIMDEHDLAREGHPEIIKQTVYFLANYEDQEYVPQESEIRQIALMDYETAMAVLQFESFRRILTAAHDFIKSKDEKIFRE